MSGNGENPRNGGVCCLSLKMGKRQNAFSAIRTTHIFSLSFRAMPLFLLCPAWRKTVKVALRAVSENEQSRYLLNTVNRIIPQLLFDFLFFDLLLQNPILPSICWKYAWHFWEPYFPSYNTFQPIKLTLNTFVSRADFNDLLTRPCSETLQFYQNSLKTFVAIVFTHNANSIKNITFLMKVIKLKATECENREK